MSAEQPTRSARGDIDVLADGLDRCLDIDASQPLDELIEAIGERCRQATAHRDAFVLLRLRSGAQAVGGWPDDVPLATVNRWERTVHRLERLASVTVAAASGTCAGPSLRLLLAADYRIATPDLRLVPPTNEGAFWPGMELYRVVHEIGRGHARALVLRGDTLSADQALELGILDRISNEIGDAVRAAMLAQAHTSGQEHALRRQLLVEAATTTFEEALGSHLAACERELRRRRTSLSA